VEGLSSAVSGVLSQYRAGRPDEFIESLPLSSQDATALAGLFIKKWLMPKIIKQGRQEILLQSKRPECPQQAASAL